MPEQYEFIYSYLAYWLKKNKKWLIKKNNIKTYNHYFFVIFPCAAGFFINDHPAILFASPVPASWGYVGILDLGDSARVGLVVFSPFSTSIKKLCIDIVGFYSIFLILGLGT